MEAPCQVIEPDDGRSSPEIVRNKVLLPAPFAPITVVIFDSWADNEMSSSAITEPKEVVRFSIFSTTHPPTGHRHSGWMFRDRQLRLLGRA